MARPAVPASRLVDSLGNIAREWRDFLVPSIADWSPAGNGIAFASAVGAFVRRGRQVDIYLDVTWPATASGATAWVAGLPHEIGDRYAGIAVAHTNQGAPFTIFGQPHTSIIALSTFAGAILTNADMSGKRLVASGTYLL